MVLLPGPGIVLFPSANPVIEFHNSPYPSYLKKGNGEYSLRDFAIGITSFRFYLLSNVILLSEWQVDSLNNIQLLKFKQTQISRQKP